MIYVIGVLVLLWAVTGVYAVRLQADVKANDRVHEVQLHLAQGIIERLTDAERRHDEIESGLREQIQHLAERLSTLRVEKNARPEQDRFEPTPKAPEPYSQALQGFLQAIHFEEARLMVIDDIERLRDEGYGDEQILDILNK
jgi:hypothetical protein